VVEIYTLIPTSTALDMAHFHAYVKMKTALKEDYDNRTVQK